MFITAVFYLLDAAPRWKPAHARITSSTSPTLARQVSLAPDARRRVERARAVVDRMAAGGAPVYGINTGFGALAETTIPRESLGRCIRIFRAVTRGGGGPAARQRGPSVDGAAGERPRKRVFRHRPGTLELLIDMLIGDVHPVVPHPRVVGASGDLAPLAHLSLVLVGEGFARLRRPVVSQAPGAAAAGPMPVTLSRRKGWR